MSRCLRPKKHFSKEDFMGFVVYESGQFLKKLGKGGSSFENWIPRFRLIYFDRLFCCVRFSRKKKVLQLFWHNINQHILKIISYVMGQLCPQFHPWRIDIQVTCIFEVSVCLVARYRKKYNLKNIPVKGENSHVRAVGLVASTQIWAPAPLYYSTGLLRKMDRNRKSLRSPGV